MKKYRRIISLDFELYNSYCYWSICWSGAVTADLALNETDRYVKLYNPVTKQKRTGNKIKFPFTYSDLAPLKSFGGAGRELLEMLTDDTLVIGHAVDNDVRMIIEACQRFGLGMPSFDYLDTVVAYGAVRNVMTARSLTNLAAEYGFEFNAHDPCEDAAATLEVLRRILKETDCEGDIAAFTEKFGIRFGRLQQGLIRACYSDAFTGKARKHIENRNALFDAVTGFDKEVKPLPAFKGRKYFFLGSMTAEQDVSPVALKLLSAGAKITGNQHTADFTVTNRIDEEEMLGQSDNILLKTLVSKLGMTAEEVKDMDFKPAKITTMSGMNISYENWLRNLYPMKNAQTDELKGVRFVFSMTADRLYGYETAYREIIRRGGTVTYRVRGAKYFVLRDESQLETDKFDLRIAALKTRAGKNVEVITFDRLADMLGIQL